jgi:hypothetical protein
MMRDWSLSDKHNEQVSDRTLLRRLEPQSVYYYIDTALHKQAKEGTWHAQAPLERDEQGLFTCQQVRLFLRFFRSKRESALRMLESEFEDAKNDR